MTTTAPKKLLLTCTITGKQVTWTNQKIIQAKIDQFGSLEAFTAQYQSKGAGKAVKVKAQIIKPILEQGVALGKMTSKEYTHRYPAQVVHQHGYEQVTEDRNGTEHITRKWTNKDGSTCTVTAPVPKASTVVDHHEVDTTCHAASKALKALKGKSWKGVTL
jgi:hypothetical protein